jgi:hypothetical protein
MILTPIQELQKVALIGLATTWRCHHCNGRAQMMLSEIVSADVCPYAVEHFHEDDCPDHEDNQDAAKMDFG